MSEVAQREVLQEGWADKFVQLLVEETDEASTEPLANNVCTPPFVATGNEVPFESNVDNVHIEEDWFQIEPESWVAFNVPRWEFIRESPLRELSPNNASCEEVFPGSFGTSRLWHRAAEHSMLLRSIFQA